MAFNPRPQPVEENKDESIIKLDKPVSPTKTAEVDTSKLPGYDRYYMEWWNYGAPSDKRESAEFGTAFIKRICQLMLSDKCGPKRSITFLKRLSDGKVLWDKK